MKYKNRILSFLTVICCLAGSILPAYNAAANEVSSGSEVPRAVFTNKPKPAPDLYVTKQLENPESYTEDTPQFSFTLYLNGEPAPSSRTYKVKDASGEFKKDEKGNERTFYTDNGIFQLGAGETAWFKDIGVNTRYEVEETGYTMPTVDGETVKGSFQQVTPEGGVSASGVMTARGKEEIFVNQYIPEEEGETTTLKVKKSCPFLSGYEAPETPNFHFTIKIRGKAYGNKEFTIVDADGDIKGAGETNKDGAFTLKGGYTAEFAEVDAGVDFEVKEVEGEMPDGWWAIGGTSKDGKTSAPETPVNFTNSNASFAVSKQMKDGTKPDVDFMFLLMKEDNSVWAGAQYYLYDTATKKLVEPPKTEETTDSDNTEETTNPDDTEKQLDSNNTKETMDPDNTETSEEEFKNPTTTKSDGTFTLKPGQVAVFTGIIPGTTYSVKEVRNPEWSDDTVDYRQVTPESIDGYTETVGNSILPLPFENEEIINNGTLTVTKRVENVKGDAPENPDKTFFRFKLSKVEEHKDDNGNITSTESVVKNMDYELLEGGETKSGKTNENGEFTLRADAIARFKTLEFSSARSPFKYKVEEITTTGDNFPIGYKIADEDRVKSEELVRGGNVSFTFTNQYLADRLDLTLIKESRKGQKLKDAAFRLWRVNAEEIGNPEDLKWEDIDNSQKTEVGTYVTGIDGKLGISGLESGVYFLQEVQSPLGYVLPDEPWKLVIQRNVEDRTKITVKIDDKTVSNGGDTTNLEAIEKDLNSISLVKKLGLTPNETGRDQVELTLLNNVVYSLPNSGGPGIFLYIVSGIVLMMAASYLYWKKLRARAV